VSPRDAACGVPLAARVPAMGHGGTFSHTLLTEANSTNAGRSVLTGPPPTRWHRALGIRVLVAGHRCPYLVASQAIAAHRQASTARARALPSLLVDQERGSC
jgi:hypothetical protein